MAAWKGLVAAVAGLVGLALAPLGHAQAPAVPILEAPTILGLPETSHPSVRRFLNLNTLWAEWHLRLAGRRRRCGLCGTNRAGQLRKTRGPRCLHHCAA